VILFLIQTVLLESNPTQPTPPNGDIAQKIKNVLNDYTSKMITASSTTLKTVGQITMAPLKMLTSSMNTFSKAPENDSKQTTEGNHKIRETFFQMFFCYVYVWLIYSF